MRNDMNMENLKLEIDRDLACIKSLISIRDAIRLIELGRKMKELEKDTKCSCKTTDCKPNHETNMTEKLKYRFNLESQLCVEAESKASAYRMAYEELADLNWKFRSTRIQLDDIRIKEGWE